MEDISPFEGSNPFAIGRGDGIAFTLKDTIYFGGGMASSFGSFFAPGDLYYFFPNESDPFEQWIFAGEGEYEELKRSNAISFVIGDRAFYGLGEDVDGNQLSDFYEFDPIRLINFENPFLSVDSLSIALDGDCQRLFSGGRRSAVSFVLNGKGYVLTGARENTGSGQLLKDVWSFDPAANNGNGAWTCLGAFPGGERQGASAFVIGNKAYVTSGAFPRTGITNLLYNDIWAFDGTNWEQKTAFTGVPRRNAIAFSLNGKGYLATGRFQDVSDVGIIDKTLTDIWEYTPEKE